MPVNRPPFLSVVLGLVLAFSAVEANANLIVNGGFEDPVTTDFTTIPAGSPLLTGWTITAGSVDVISPVNQPVFAGNQALDLDGDSPGTIEQAFATVVGGDYLLTFAYANNAFAGASSASANVSLSGAGSSDLLSEDITHSGSTVDDMNYTLFSFNFTANSTTTLLRFTSLDPATSNGGVILDAVSVTASAVPEPSALCLLGVGAAILAFRPRRRRLA